MSFNALLSYTFISGFMTTSSQHLTTTITSNNAVNDTFWICSKLNEYGCNSPYISDTIRAFINQYTPDDYYLPTHRCDYQTINLTYIGHYLDISLLSSVNKEILSELPCEILIQLPFDILEQKNISYLIDYDYWFKSNRYLLCNDSLIIICSNVSNNSQSISINPCYLDDTCLYPFVPSSYTKHYPAIAGMCQCGLDCRLRPSKWKLPKLDATMFVSSIISFVCLFIYSINVISEWYTQRKDMKRLGDTPILVDIPPIVAAFLFVFIMSYSSPNYIGRQYYICEELTEWNVVKNVAMSRVYSPSLPESNMLCYISGICLYLAITIINNYFAFLSFAIYRYMSHPLKPLWKINKCYWHLLVITYTSAFAVVLIRNNGIAGDQIFATCGPAFNASVPSACILINASTALASNIIFTPLNLYHIWKHKQYTKDLGGEQANYQDLSNLYNRLIAYSVIALIYIVSLLYTTALIQLQLDDLNLVVNEYFECLFKNFQIGLDKQQQQQIIADGSLLEYMADVCVMDPNNIFPELNAIWIILSIAATLLAIGSMAFSCSLKKYHQWRTCALYTKKEMKIRLMSISLKQSNMKTPKQSITTDIANDQRIFKRSVDIDESDAKVIELQTHQTARSTISNTNIFSNILRKKSKESKSDENKEHNLPKRHKISGDDYDYDYDNGNSILSNNKCVQEIKDCVVEQSNNMLESINECEQSNIMMYESDKDDNSAMNKKNSSGKKSDNLGDNSTAPTNNTMNE